MGRTRALLMFLVLDQLAIMGRTCPTCNSSEIDEDPSRGEATCMSCGRVLEESRIVSDMQFQENGAGGHSIIGMKWAYKSAWHEARFEPPSLLCGWQISLAATEPRLVCLAVWEPRERFLCYVFSIVHQFWFICFKVALSAVSVDSLAASAQNLSLARSLTTRAKL